MQSADHVVVHHRDGSIERDRGPVHIVTGADQAELLGAEEREDEGAAGTAGRRERARQPEDHRGAGAVVVGARVHDAVDAAEVVVVRADHDGLGRERRVDAGQNADDVRGACLVGDLLDADVRAGARRERHGPARRGQSTSRIGDRSTGGRQDCVSDFARDGAREQADLDRRVVRRRQIVAHDQQGGGAASLGRDQLVEAPHARARRLRGCAVERERDLSTYVDTSVVVVGGVRALDSIADEHDLTADLAGERAAVGDPVTPGVEPPQGRPEQIEAARRTGPRRRLEDERLEKRSRVAAWTEARGGQPVCEPPGG